MRMQGDVQVEVIPHIPGSAEDRATFRRILGRKPADGERLEDLLVAVIANLVDVVDELERRIDLLEN